MADRTNRELTEREYLGGDIGYHDHEVGKLWVDVEDDIAELKLATSDVTLVVLGQVRIAEGVSKKELGVLLKAARRLEGVE